MQGSNDNVHISPVEWRWVVLMAGLFVGLAFVPFLWVAFSGSAHAGWQFMGALTNYRDGATYLAKMQQGAEGSWQILFWHTPEAHSPAFLAAIYPALGNLSRILGLPVVAVYHVARVIASLLMYSSLYYLAATVYPYRIRARRIFFLLAAMTSGLGWLFAPFTGLSTYPDLAIPEMFPFYSSLVNVHFPLALTCITLIATLFVTTFRPGMTRNPQVDNGGLLVVLLSFLLSILYPHALIPLCGAVALYTLFHTVQARKLALRELFWLMALALPAAPLAVYYAAVVNYNPAVAGWNNQNVTLSPALPELLIGLGLTLLIGLPAIYRAVRRFEQDGDQFMLLWLALIVIALFLPTSVQRRFGVGIMIPIAYFAVRALSDFWYPRIALRWHKLLMALFTPLMILSSVFVLLSSTTITEGPFLQQDYASAFQWLRAYSHSPDVILASEEVSLWIPSWVGARVVYGHPFETLDANTKHQQVIDWYSGADNRNCRALLDEYQIRYVIDGPQEAQIGQNTCLQKLTPAAVFGSVTIYAP
jgi:hypothetical protein